MLVPNTHLIKLVITDQLLDVTFQKAIRNVVEDVQDLLEHADISTTQIYLHTAKQSGVGVQSPYELL